MARASRRCNSTQWALGLLLGLTCACGPAPVYYDSPAPPTPPPAAPEITGECTSFAKVADTEAIQAAYAEFGIPLAVIGDTAYRCSCDQRLLGGNTEGRQLAGDTEGRQLGGDTEGRQLAGDTEGRQLAGDTEGRQLAGDTEGRQLAGDTEGRQLGGDTEGRQLAGDTEGRQLAGDIEGRQLAGDTEDRALGGDTEAVPCHTTPNCPGYVVGGTLSVSIYDGSALRLAPDRCVF